MRNVTLWLCGPVALCFQHPPSLKGAKGRVTAGTVPVALLRSGHRQVQSCARGKEASGSPPSCSIPPRCYTALNYKAHDGRHDSKSQIMGIFLHLTAAILRFGADTVVLVCDAHHDVALSSDLILALSACA